MKYDFCLVASWSEQSQKQLVLWGRELENRGYTVAIVSPSPSKLLFKSELHTFVLSDLGNSNELSSVEAVESRYGIPSVDHLIFTERQFYQLSRSEALSRTVNIANSYHDLFAEHSFKYTFQGRGPEIHKLLAHYITEHENGVSIWAEFSPFDDTYALTTSLDGRWDNYQTIPYEDIPGAEREATHQHIKQFREERRFYAKNDDGDGSGAMESVISKAIESAKNIIGRTRPGQLRDQIRQEAHLELNRRVTDYLLPTVEESRQLCRDTKYVFFPLQYPIESRLTVFSPQFYNQLYLVEYLGRILPSSTQLFVKGHPHHPGHPAPERMRRVAKNDQITFLHYDMHAHETIEHAEAIVVVNNTIGYESIYYQKPLLALGTPTYADTPAVTQVPSLADLPEILSEKISTTVQEETTVESIYSLQETSWDGNTADYSAENVQTVVDSIVTFCGE